MINKLMYVFLWHRSEENDEYNDIPVIYEQEDFDALIKGGIDAQLAQHIAHLFIRDPVSLFSEKIHQDNTKDSDHFEVSVDEIEKIMFYEIM